MSVTVTKHMPFLLLAARFKGVAAGVTINGNINCDIEGVPSCDVSTTSTSSEFKCTITCTLKEPTDVNSISAKVVGHDSTNVEIFNLTSQNCQISNATTLTIYLSQKINIQQQ